MVALNSNDTPVDTLDYATAHYGVKSPTPFKELLLALCRSASRYVKIISPRLDHLVFDNTELSDALAALARSGSNSRVDILISDSRPIIQNGHRLLNLARRLPSSVSIRKLADHPEMTGETVVLRDLNGILFMPGDEGLGFYDPDSRASTQPFIDKFEPLWQRAQPDPEFRRLGL
ncbi:MAG: hypothetical protein ACJAUG_001999 [Halioglobus sp.]